MSTASASLSQPPGFPAGIPVSKKTFTNWDQVINVPDLWTCSPVSAAQVEAICNWAAGSGYQVRATGIRHTWSPLTVTSGTAPDSNIILVDTTASLNAVVSITAASGKQAPQVKVQTGCTMLALMTALEQASGGGGDANGYSFPHIPAPGNLTVGGVLAIDAHGTAISSTLENSAAGYGSMSNHILAFTAVVSDPTTGIYASQTFTRGQAGGDDNVFLAHLGRAFLIDVTLQLIPNYNLRCQSFTNISAQTLFASPTSTNPVPANSLASFLNQTGRVEAIWYPFSTNPWLKVWSHSATLPSGSKAVSGPYNYPFSDNLPDFVTGLFKMILGVPVDVATIIAEFVKWLMGLGSHSSNLTAAKTPLPNFISQGWALLTCVKNAISNGGGPLLTPCVGQIMALVTEVALALDNSDIWGPSKDTMIYIEDSTLLVTANGYAISMNRANVQQAVSEFVNIFNTLLTSFQKSNQYPVNAPLEIRVTGLDDPQFVAATGAASPAISALNYDAEAKANNWDVALWLDVLTLPNTPASNDFYTQLETALNSNPWFNGTNGRIRPEWSKGWAYTSQGGAWSSNSFIQQIRQSFTGWDTEVAALSKYDSKQLFFNPFLSTLFS